MRGGILLFVAEGREVYPHAPLVFVTCEMRFPLAPSLGSDATLEALTAAFRDGPLFVIDTDSFRVMPDERMLDFDVQALEPVLDDLHEPLGEVFERCITDRARAVFRGAT